MDGLEELQSLSALAKVTEMLKNYLDVDQPELAEFIIFLAKKAKDVEDFNKLLDENEANMSYDFVNQLYRTIIALDPPKRALIKTIIDEWDEIINRNDDQVNFPALTLKNDPNREELKAPKIKNELSDWAKELLERENPNIRVCDFGAFVEFETSEGVYDGLVHISQVSEKRKIINIQDVIKRNQKVYVKVTSIEKHEPSERDSRRKRLKISLTMKNVNQSTGKDTSEESYERGYGSELDTSKEYEEFELVNNKKRKYMNDIDRWENQQLLKRIVLSPIKLVARPEGSLSRTIASSLAIQHENKMMTMKDEQYSEKKEDTSNIMDYYKNAVSTKSRREERRGPERENLVEKRRNLPVYKLKKEIVEKVIANKILIVIGETGSGKTTQIPQYLHESDFCKYSSFIKLIKSQKKDENREKRVDNTGNSKSDDSRRDKSKSDDSRRDKSKSDDSRRDKSKSDDSRRDKSNGDDSRRDKSNGDDNTSGSNRDDGTSGSDRDDNTSTRGNRDDSRLDIRPDRRRDKTGHGRSSDDKTVHGKSIDDRVEEKRMIGITQPRRVSCISVAKRVSEEMGCILGNEVGYSIRFNDCTSSSTLIKYMTDGMLLREILHDPYLYHYSTIMLDEAHERTISTDVLFALLKETCLKRDDFRLIVTSATLESEKFSKYFLGAEIFKIPGRFFPVEILHSKEQEMDYLEAALITVLNIHLNEKPGDILVFLTVGQEDIETGCKILNERMKKLENLKPPPLIVLPIYAALPTEVQTQIFMPSPPGTRKCILATNIAEASITIDGILYVIDPGLCKVKSYNPKTGMESLVVAPISKANARQRSGRAGRTAPGKCYRLYTESTFYEEMLPTPVPEIQRVNLTNVVIILKAMGINDFIHFDFMDRPCNEMLIDALDVLYHLGALDEEGLLTRVGRKMAQFPMDPTLSKVLLTSIDLDCCSEIITIISMLSVQNIFYRPPDKKEKSDQSRLRYFQTEGDHLTYLNIYQQWQKNSFSNYYCYQNFLQYRALLKVQEIRKQLISILDHYNFHNFDKRSLDSRGINMNKVERIQKSICSGFFHHSAKRGEESYRTLLDEQNVYIHPSSSLHRRSPEYVVYHELVLTTKEYMRDLTVIKSKWLLELAPTMFVSSGGDKGKFRGRGVKKNIKIQPLHNKFDKDQDSWRLSKRRL
ncbi:ATP-dependent helicase [Theileria orientalis strain Shintoku]|uniref:RNA helicase n=1 Tax=Theileria orientalis strain Shintoku TaxID=869250 RepID=J4D5L5_THEOR|nr:ATP-dependent helicase [Theileria orientalis strain Shintoku]BAM39040.1 ATP-dependent helicase [Theileria orientalis strain Shintoku]|eukprot:XP_009689341.1 ATP-dependent helicase [Theileria orientalis strain Shintoku]